MKQTLKTVSLSTLVALLLCGCTGQKETNLTEETVAHNSIYHWQTTFSLDSCELAFLHCHNIDRIYMHMFDVAVEHNYKTQAAEVVPIATTKFTSSIPEKIEVVPVAYITLDALRLMRDKEDMYASLIVERLLAMCSYNECGVIKELQIDCDWTQTTENSYFTLCRSMRQLLQEKGVQLSVTIRLHQLCSEVPPVDKGVLMLYNTGALKNYETHNSILDIDDVRPYIKSASYELPLDYAFPAFGWGVKFVDEKFVSIVSEQDSVTADNEYIRKERASYADIMNVKELVEAQLGKPLHGNILYHLDNSQLNNYTQNEIEQILAH